MVPALFVTGLALAAPATPSSLHVVFQVGADAAHHRVVATTPTTAHAPRDTHRRHGPSPVVVQLVDAEGHVLSSGRAADPRHRSLVDVDGHHAPTQRLVAAAGHVLLPWHPDAVAVTIDGHLRPLPDVPDLLEPTGWRDARPPPAAVPIVSSGTDDQRLDLVFLGDGYTAEELPDFADDVDRMVDYLLSIEPYGDYASLFNVWRIDAASAESGVSHEEGVPVARDTAYGCYYGCAGLDRLVCCDDVEVLQTVGTALPGAEGIMVLVNDDAYGGSGGFAYATSYVGDDFGTQVAAHELGHTLVGLWDEYGYGIDGDGEGPNCATDDAGAWDEWLGADGVDAFPECSYNSLHRPTLEGCMMRTLQDGYCPVCRQEAVLAMYERLPGLILGVSPPTGNVGSAPTTFEVELVAEDVLKVEWLLDGALIATGATFAPDCFAQSGTLSVRVTDDTSWVRDDPDALLTETEGAWLVTASECTSPATTATPSLADTGEPASLSCACQGAPTGWGSWWTVGSLWWMRRRR